jgi:acylphosphatase
MTTARFIVRGRVQGVGFRAGTRRKALQLGLMGSARNLGDGSVEVIAQGEPLAIESLALWLERGPPHARVDAVHRTELGAQAPLSDFDLG